MPLLTPNDAAAGGVLMLVKRLGALSDVPIPGTQSWLAV
ncbi:hypothetical protein AVDCRST_MAG94-5136 [uncultured Leptolyngbya sp.]|uniref:Uncharacterized protein n=1 Tax=uncultured Leptolyngbya sp. TaxID=332963 RepID=A0A6J4NE84_9CYAN|nr:hypothetical protein AVDCRST_MAG94-5136 [uncultured Leptolyngbya sp.]